MGKRLGAALDELRAAVFEAYAALAEEGAKTDAEQQRRESSLQSIDEILEWRPLALVKAFADMPATGWIRGDAAASEELLVQINKLHNRLALHRDSRSILRW